MPTPAIPPIEEFHRSIVRLGGAHGHMRDLYAALLRARWRVLLGLFALLYLAVNVIFATAYLVAGDAISGARPGSFEDAFSFSVQTLSTVGYGALSPTPPIGNAIVAVETFVGLLLVAMATGIVFSKFARASAGLLFSDKAVVGPRNGQPCLMIRIANSRGSDLVEASVRLTAIKNEVTAEGHRMRRLHDMAVERTTTPVLLLSWLVIHPIDEKSPLRGMTAEDLARGDVRIFANVTGIEGVFMQTVFAYTVYDHSRIVMDAHFADMLRPVPDGRTVVDLRRLSDVVPHVPGAPRTTATAATSPSPRTTGTVPATTPPPRSP